MRRTLLRLAPSSLPNTHVRTRLPPLDVSKILPGDDPTGEIKPGEHVISVCKQHNIAFPDRLRPLSGLKLKPNPYRLAVSVCQQHCFAKNSMPYFDKLEHPFAKTLLDIYIERKKEPLWITSYAHGAGVFPSKKAGKKIVHALRDALIAAGYDRFGRRVLADGESSAIVDLYGTLRVVSNNPTAVCDAKFMDLLEDAKKIIASVEVVLRRDQSGRHVGNPQQQQRWSTHGARQGQKREPSNQRGRRTG
ncbi:hypothetical protein F4801DRAFT_57575 [Xylaria longipes]|nr:hypothetical protein F4801DRAFT_57575 [Xylaria longipes]RYC60651.1 hypothetical protein CHU98_g5569 [Xylaria longipes]